MNFGLDLATSLTVRIYVPQSGKAVVGGPQLTDGSQCQSFSLQKYNEKYKKYKDKYKTYKDKYKDQYKNTKNTV